jgi:hypothetical protein
MVGKRTSKAVIFSLAFAAGLALTGVTVPPYLFSPLDGGPFDFRPRLEASAVSRDNNLAVKIYRQRDPNYSRFVGAVVFVEVHDSQGRVLYRDEYGRDGAWSELNIKYGINFEHDQIHVTRIWCPPCGPNPSPKVIRMSELGVSRL